uniref:Uncharacterized protein n=1 Tax=Salix viminalis TaxID=40686 RepID=A0A6N2N9G1_SALVM
MTVITATALGWEADTPPWTGFCYLNSVEEALIARLLGFLNWGEKNLLSGPGLSCVSAKLNLSGIPSLYMSPNNPSSSPQSLIQGIPSSICFVPGFENKAYRGNQWLVRSRKPRKNGGRCSLPSSFAFFARREPRQNSAGNMTSFLTTEFTVVLVVERRFTNPPPNLTLAVDGLLSTKVSLQP